MKIDKVTIIKTPQKDNQVTITAVAEVSYYIHQNNRRTETFKSIGSNPIRANDETENYLMSKEQLAELRQHLNVFGLMIDGPLQVTNELTTFEVSP